MKQCDPAEPYYDEAERLAVLDDYEVLDTPREKEFDDIVELAAQICDVPISVITLIAEGRQWFKAEKGLGISETPLDISICAHAILQHDIFEIQDTTKDARFVENPVVTGDMNLRFYTGAVLKSPEGLPVGMLCVLDRKPRQLNDQQKFALQVLGRQVMSQLELKKSLRQLELKNAELVHFSHAIAHDLRDPLSSVKLLTEIFQKFYGKGLDDRAAEILQSIANSTERSLALLTSMLAYAEAEDRELLPENCDGRQVLAETVENLHSVIKTAGAKVVAENLSAVDMGSGELGQVLQNLIGNAINYRDASRPAQICVSSETDEQGRVKMTVSDNGIGIAPENIDKIFAPLKRLHGSDRPGTGLGLTISRRIIERRGGRIWVESTLGQGTTFCFTVPAMDEQKAA